MERDCVDGNPSNSGGKLPRENGFIWNHLNREQYQQALTLPHFQKEINSILSDTVVEPNEAVGKLTDVIQSVAKMTLKRKTK
jgi:hypothetical protein